MIKLNINTRTHDAIFSAKVIDDTTIEIMCDNKTATIVIDDKLFEKTDDYITFSDTKLPYNPNIKVFKTGDDYIVNTFFDDVYTSANPDPALPHSQDTLVVRPDLSERKTEKKLEMINHFNRELETGWFHSDALGIDIDCRRTNTKNDLQNVQGLISNMTRKGKGTITYVGKTEIKQNVNKTQLTDLTAEMEDYALALYEKKWTLEAQVNVCTTIQELDNIKW